MTANAVLKGLGRYGAMLFLTCALIAAGCAASPSSHPRSQPSPTSGVVPPEDGAVKVSVSITQDLRLINPHIYGVSRSDGAQPYYREMGVTLVRWGGNARSRFNWELNASNTGADWGFTNLSKGDGTPGSAALKFHQNNRSVGADSLLMLPMIGWVARDRGEAALSVGGAGPLGAITGVAEGSDVADARLRTILPSFPRKGGPFSYPPDLTDQAVYQDEWVYFLTRTLGPSDKTGIRFYEMDNEPMLWSVTHADVHPEPVSYDYYLDRFLQYARAVKDVDPSARILAPSVWGWTAYFYSALDTARGGPGSAPDRKAHGDVPFLPWFLSKVREHDEHLGVRTLDYLAVHYYPQGGVFSDDIAPETQARRLRSTRSLWDPTYADESWIATTPEGPFVRLIPRLREWIDQNYPGTGLAITEWSWGAEGHISGGLAAADVLGIFGREGVDLATFWGEVGQGSPVYWAFRMYRNYDGLGSHFGNISVRAQSSHPDLVSAYASLDTSTGQVKVMLINKSPDHEVPVRLTLKGFPRSTVDLFQYSAAHLGGIQQLPRVEVQGDTLEHRLPPYSMTMVAAST